MKIEPKYSNIIHRLTVVQLDKFINILIIPIFFSLFFYYKDGQTLGQKMLGTKIVHADDKKELRWWQLLGRPFAKILSTLPFLAGFLAADLHEQKQAWHDSIANTKVINTKPQKGWKILLTLYVSLFFSLIFSIFISVMISKMAAISAAM